MDIQETIEEFSIDNPREFIQEIVASLNERSAGGWSVGTCIESTEKTIEFNHSYIDDGVRKIWTTWYVSVQSNWASFFGATSSQGVRGEWASLKSDAQAATNAANTKAALANEKAALANEKAALANEKARAADSHHEAD